jgi:eukaryotic-like serine/threonine-protein kinase
MTPERWSAIREIFDAVVELPPEHRAKALEQGCGGDPALRAELEAILEHSERAPAFVDEPLFTGRKGAPAEDAGDALLGRRIGAYLVESTIASGGMGTVYRGSRADQQFYKQVALKVVKRGMDSGEIVRRFSTERQILANLNHPNIVALLDAGVLEDGRPYLVMELVDGTPIDRYCRAHRLSVTARIELVLRVCAAVHHAHQHLLVHRDLKPGNILVTPEGVPKLLDFGIAKLLRPDDGDGTQTRPGWLPMTPRYASPEQLQGGPVTTATDIFALGVILHELLAGPPLEKAGEPSDGAGATWGAPPRAAPSAAVTPEAAAEAGSTEARMRRRMKGDLDAIVQKALHQDPRRRYASAEQLSDELGRHLAGLPVRAREGTWSYRASRFLRRNAWAVAAGAAVFASLSVAALATWRGMIRAEESERLAWRAHTQAVQAAAFNHDLLATIDADTLRDNRAILAQLERTARRVDTDLADLPEAQGRMRYTLAHTFARLERWEEAETHARAAASLAKSTRGFGAADQGAYLHLLGEVLLAREDPGAIAVFEQALGVRIRHHGADHPRTAETRDSLANARSRLAQPR